MSAKHVINKPEDCVLEALHGLAFLNPLVEIDEANKVVACKDIPADRVHVICGGGSGHEPSHASMVGPGVLSLAVCGAPFASPNSTQITSALHRTAGTRGTLLVVKQYTGDVLSFGLAKERFAATHPEAAKNVRTITVGDDVAVGRQAGEMVGRRGLAGTCLVYKVAGALAAQGSSLDDVYRAASYVAANTATIGVGLDHCSCGVPGSKPSSDSKLGADEVEVGMGIHNEPGVRTMQLSGANRLVADLMHQLTSISDADRSYVPFKLDGNDEVVLLVNNLGALPELELSIVVKDVGQWLIDSHFKIVRVLSGQFMTSFAMPGFSITLLRLPRREDKEADRDVIIDAIDAKCDAPGWKWTRAAEPAVQVLQKGKEKDERKHHAKPSAAETETRGPAPIDPATMTKCIQSACKALIAADAEVTEYDRALGDGDAGRTLKAGAKGVLKGLDELDVRVENLSQTFVQISGVCEKNMGGTSGALYSIFFSALASSFAEQKEVEKADNASWSKALEHALNQLYRYTRARPPSRTLVDPLAAFISTLVYDNDDVGKAFDSAAEAAEATKFLESKHGRSSYVDSSKVKDANVPDAGAWGVYKLLEGVKSALNRADVANP